MVQQDSWLLDQCVSSTETPRCPFFRMLLVLYLMMVEQQMRWGIFLSEPYSHISSPNSKQTVETPFIPKFNLGISKEKSFLLYN